MAADAIPPTEPPGPATAPPTSTAAGPVPSTPASTDGARHARFELDVQTSHTGEPLDTGPAAPLAAQREVEASQTTLKTFAELGEKPPPAAASPLAGDDADHSGPAQPPHEGPLSVVDIEHVYVDDDPREWSPRKKFIVTCIVSIGALTPTLAASIYNPAFQQLREELNATESELALSLSLFILFQGGMPVFWSAVGEIIGRKPVYLIAQTIFIVGTIVCSRANSMALLIVFRIIQACGSSAVLSLGAGTLADMYEVKERGQKMGYYYGVPLIGPAIGPLFGGALTQASSWRSTFYFIAGLAGLQGIGFILYPDTWRKERSVAYQVAVKRSVARAFHAQEVSEEKRRRKEAKGLKSSDPTPAPTRPSSPSQAHRHVEIEVEEKAGLGRRRWWIVGKRLPPKEETSEFQVSIRDINPLRPAFAILSNPVNLFIIMSSGTIFAGQYTVAVTSAITFAEAPYDYDALHIGLVLVAFGGGNIIGSVVGGILSDWVLARLKRRNGGVGNPEMRLKSMFPSIPIMVGSFLAFAWTSQEKTNIAGPLVCLFCSGFSMMTIYSSVLAYLVDANVGRSASAIACNSLFRGVLAFLMSEVALPLRNGIGDGGLYTLYSGLLALASCSFILLAYKGEAWRKSNPWRKTKPEEQPPAKERA